MEDKPILILACSGSKLDVPAMAIDIYQGTLFKRGRAYAEKHGLPVLILSAKLGFIQPTLWVEPYNQRFTDTYRGAWPDGSGYYLGGQDYFGAAPDRFKPLVPSDRIGKMVFYMDQLDALGRDELFRRVHAGQRGLNEALVHYLTHGQVTADELLAAMRNEFGNLPGLDKNVKAALRPSFAKTAGLNLYSNGGVFWLA